MDVCDNNLLAFAFHIVADLTYDLWHQAVSATGTRRDFFQRMRSITVYWVFSSWMHLLAAMAFKDQLPQPP